MRWYNTERRYCCLREKNRLDGLFFHDIKVEEMHPELAMIMKIIFTLSHGEASVERGFNGNNVVLKQNQKHKTVASGKFIKNHMATNNLLLHTVFPLSAPGGY